MKNIKDLPLIDKYGYGIGNFGYGIMIQVMSTYLIFYSTVVLKIPGGLVGIAISLSIIWDAITDPLMGYLSDLTTSKAFGRRHLYILIGTFGMAISNYVMWNINADYSTTLKFTIICINIFVMKTFITVYTTPYSALGAELSFDYNGRTAIQAIRTAFFLLGIGFISGAGLYIFFPSSELYPIGQLNPNSYSNMGVVTSIMIVFFGLTCYITTKKYIPYLNSLISHSSDEKKSLLGIFPQLIQAVKNNAFRFVALGYMFTNISSAILANIGLHVFTFTFFLSSRDIALIVGVQFLICILSQPVWTYIAAKLDKKPSVIIGLALCIISCLIFIVMVFYKDGIRGNPFYFIPFAVLAGFGTGGLFSIPLSMVADTIDLGELESGKRYEGIYYGCLTLFYKLSQSIAILIVGFYIDLVKFNPDLPLQSESTVVSLGFMLGLGSLGAFVFALLSYRKYNLDKLMVISIQNTIISNNKNQLTI